MKRYAQYILVVLVIILSGCANVVPLDGGDPDKIPPRVIKTQPDTFSLNFKGRRLLITFDEYVVVRNPSQQVVVSPPVMTQPVVQVTKKSVEVIFQDSLRENTTYIIQFGKAIQDNNEGNVLENYSFVFSTGPVLDSLEASTVILDAFTLKPVAGAKWMLYPERNDSAGYFIQPYYVGISNATGVADLRYMRPGTFSQFALLETNGNLIYDAGDERIAFSDSIVTTGDSVVHRLLMFSERPRQNRLRSAKMNGYGKVAFRFNDDARGVSIRPLNDSLPPFRGNSEYVTEGYDSLVYWYPRLAIDTLFFEYSIPGQGTDTVRVVNRQQRSQGKRNIEPVDTSSRLGVKSNITPKFDYFRDVLIEFDHPVPRFDSTCLKLIENRMEMPYYWEFADTLKRKLVLKYPFRQGTDYVLSLRDRCFTDIWELYNDSLLVAFKTTQDKEYSVLELQLQGVAADMQLIFQLLDKDDKVVSQQLITSQGDVFIARFDKLLPGMYRVKLIYDYNRNGVWDTGNYSQRLQPEKVSFFPQNIEIKPGFDLNFDWDVNQSAGSGGKTK